MAQVVVPHQPKISKRRERFLELSKPKAVKTVWVTSHGPRVQWGTQETLWPVTKQSMSADCSPRVIKLAEPKGNSSSQAGGGKTNQAEFMYSCGRSSMIWEVEEGAKKADASSRILQLASPKRAPAEYVDDRDHFVYSCGRSSPIWETTIDGCPPASAVSRSEDLARPKAVHRDYKPLRGVRTEIPMSALSARVSSRLRTLASPKNRPDGPFREPMWPVSGGARSAAPTNRCQELSRPKPLAEGYLPARQVVWDVPRAARRAVANQRIEELSRPIVRATMDHVQFSPDAFLVKEAALKGRCSRRVEELAAPVKR